MLLILFCFVQLLVYLLFGVQFPPGSDHIQNLSLLLMIAMIILFAELFADHFFHKIDSSEDEGDVQLFLYFAHTDLFLLHLWPVLAALEASTHLIHYVPHIAEQTEF